jgi:hypothetical protein
MHLEDQEEFHKEVIDQMKVRKKNLVNFELISKFYFLFLLTKNAIKYINLILLKIDVGIYYIIFVIVYYIY